jgi:hypothetical protein
LFAYHAGLAGGAACGTACRAAPPPFQQLTKSQRAERLAHSGGLPATTPNAPYCLPLFSTKSAAGQKRCNGGGACRDRG